MHRFVVAFQCQHVVGVGLDDFLGDFFLTAHRVHGHDAAGEFQHPQQFGQRRDFVALVTDFQLPQHQLVALGPRADHILEALLGVEGAAQRLPVQGHDFLRHGLPQALRPAQKTIPKRLGVQRGQYAVEGVVTGNPVAQRQKGFEPVVLGLAEILQVLEALTATEPRADGDHQDVPQS